jgi:hypothetical protein
MIRVERRAERGVQDGAAADTVEVGLPPTQLGEAVCREEDCRVPAGASLQAGEGARAGGDSPDDAVAGADPRG